jgi:prepilin-type N-terminal cleavage/methylation domain-containing protein
MNRKHRWVFPGWAGDRHGFTLIELLVVVAIIGLLAGIILPVLAQARQKSIRTTCLSNLKQIGLAISLYTDDNEQTLPGPCFSGARASYDRNSSTELIWYIAEDLGAPAPAPQTVVADIFVCPGYRREAPELSSLVGRKCYLLNDNLDAPPEFKPPFGYPAQAGSPAIEPMRITSFETTQSLSDIWAITDVDKVNVPNPRITWWTDLPYKPVHGDVRNELYFDWHVSARKVEF